MKTMTLGFSLVFALVACNGNVDSSPEDTHSHPSKQSGEPTQDPPPSTEPSQPSQPSQPQQPAPGGTCAALPTHAGTGNPADIYCNDMGYPVHIEETPAGQDGVCTFPDGSTCSAWAFWRGECGQAFSFCAKQGGTVAKVTENRNGGTYSTAVCTFPDGRHCEEQEFTRTCVCNDK